MSARSAKHSPSGSPHSEATRARKSAAHFRRSSMSFIPSIRICTPATSRVARNG